MTDPDSAPELVADSTAAVVMTEGRMWEPWLLKLWVALALTWWTRCAERCFPVAEGLTLWVLVWVPFLLWVLDSLVAWILIVLEILFVWCVLTSTVPIVSRICPLDVGFTALVAPFVAFVDSFMAFAVDGADAADGVEEEDGLLMELEMPNGSDHWKSPVSAMILRP